MENFPKQSSQASQKHSLTFSSWKITPSPVKYYPPP